MKFLTIVTLSVGFLIGCKAWAERTNKPVLVLETTDEASAGTRGFTDYDPRVKPFAYVSSAAVWIWEKNAPKVIFVCWENPEQSSATDRDLVHRAISETWQAHSQLRFHGWQPCAENNHGIRIRIDDSGPDNGPHTKRLGQFLDGVPDGMVLNFTFKNWSQSCAANEERRVAAYIRSQSTSSVMRSATPMSRIAGMLRASAKNCAKARMGT